MRKSRPYITILLFVLPVEDGRKEIIVKKALILLAISACIATISVIVFTQFNRRPFKDLQASDIVSATVRLTPPDKTIQITEIPELAAYLRDVVIYNKDDSYREYAGQGVTFTLTMSDGAEIDIMAYNPFVVIDGTGYRTKYEPCETLNSYANRLLRDENALIILEEPPKLGVITDETYVESLQGTYSWQRKNKDGTFTGTEADSPHPLDCKEWLEPFETTETSAVLRFTQEPDAILNVCCWSDDHWSDPSADSESVSVNGNEIELKAGGYIYEVTAKWDTEKSGCGGIAHYSFYIKVIPPRPVALSECPVVQSAFILSFLSR